ncbi:MAG: response regulator [Actinobacteria bacterium]|nr:response regulator [Actinomycetota bacterium]
MTISNVPRVLVADDDDDIRTLIVMNLELSGYQVASATNGMEAAKLARTLLPAVVVLDLMMPGMDGLEVLHGLKTWPETRDIPVLMLTAKASDQDVWQGWQAGANYYMTKPFDLDHLLHYVDYLNDPVRCPLPAD